ncbi:carbohydrate ABC transporter permease [Cohnella candidum]|uniref:Carbohydrate ABC transporter permease n=1 Tax=Cohnella candidum TaxID=2674991 RepID=A0A3G3K4D0_9BACL|nr:carbohydrate ABC transporter permease [Cohnella candidum]AYQ75308.1 carbohydrate ABC transporter permease [Cohnella candidum]
MTQQNRLIQWTAHVFLMLIALACILPFLLLFMSSIADEQAIIRDGYSLFPSAFSGEAYRYLARESSQLLRAYGITVLITIVGTTAGLILTAMLAFPLSQKSFGPRKPLTFIVFFTILFNGGLVPTYLIYTQYFDMKNTIWALIIPNLLLNGFNILLMRTFFLNSVPDAVIESAGIDGAGQFRTFTSIVLPLSTPILATVGLFQGIAYWNDWFNGVIFITNPAYFSIQNILNRILMDIQFLSSSNMSSQVGDALSAIPGTTVRMAIAVIGVIPILIAYPFFQKYFVKGIMIGAVKG